MSFSIENTTIGYGRKDIISNINLPEVKSGSLIAVIGSNAAGKSTLLKSMAGQLRYQGNMYFKERNIAAMSHQQRMESIGYLPQALPQATTLIAYELVFSACRAACQNLTIKQVEARIEKVFTRLGITELALQKMQEMSGGQRQMVGLAQVLVREPSVLLLDEPTSALDLHWQLSVLQAIREETISHQAIAFVASHDLNLSLRFCDQLLILAKGKVLAVGQIHDVLTPENLRLAYGVEGRIESCSKGYPIVLADRAYG